jgi:hypothetical protein
MHPDKAETGLSSDAATKVTHRQFVEQSIYRWRFLLAEARTQLHAQDWIMAVEAYKDAHGMAEFLVHIADCKNCAIKNYVRTLIEYGYSLCKNNQAAMFTPLIEVAQQTLNHYATPRLSQLLLQPILALEKAGQSQRDLWVNQLFASDAVQQGNVH